MIEPVLRDWLDRVTAQFHQALGDLTDDELSQPTALPGWTRAHVVAHVHFNAEALRRLVDWASSSVENPMYGSIEQRNSEIVAGARLAPTQLRSLVTLSSHQLAVELDALTPAAWARQVTTIQGRTVPATEIVWLRIREVAVHAVDLGGGVGFGDIDERLLAELTIEVVRKRAGAGELPALAAWLTGRAGAPALGTWL